MSDLTGYIDLMDYCQELSRITNIDEDSVKIVVVGIFNNINKGVYTPDNWFFVLEDKLTEMMEKKKKEQRKLSVALQ